jgi:hypothetical protein
VDFGPSYNLILMGGLRKEKTVWELVKNSTILGNDRVRKTRDKGCKASFPNE